LHEANPDVNRRDFVHLLTTEKRNEVLVTAITCFLIQGFVSFLIYVSFYNEAELEAVLAGETLEESLNMDWKLQLVRFICACLFHFQFT